MKPTLLFLMIFSVSLCTAQLYTTPSKTGDSYIYVKDALLYVEKEIILGANKTSETEASIYLRKQAELIQGNKFSNLNRGNGKLSVYQKGTSNAYDYNYWGLPVTVIPQALSLGDYIYEPLTKTESRKARLTSNLDGNSNPLEISNQWIYTFAGTGYSNWQYLGDRFDLVPGEGFSMKGVNGNNANVIEGEVTNTGSAQTYDLRGLPNDGTIEIPIKKDQIILIGNPYPSSLDLHRFLKENTATTGIAYYWDSKTNVNSHYLEDYVGGYGTYSPGIGQYVPPIFNTGNDSSRNELGRTIDRKIAPIAQGFMIIGKTDGTVTFENSHRIYAKGQNVIPYFKTAETGNSFARLNILFNDTYSKELILGFNDVSTKDEDHGMDARKMELKKSDINWIIKDDEYVINILPKVDEELIPLKLELEASSKIEFKLKDLQNFDPDRFFIYDKLEDLYFVIKTGSLIINLEKGVYLDRFYISFIEKLPVEAPKSDNIEENLVSEKPSRILLNSIEIYQNNRDQQLEITILYDANIYLISIYDLSGKQVFIKNFKSEEKEFVYPTVNLSNAVYIVKVKTTDNIEITKKVGVKN